MSTHRKAKLEKLIWKDVRDEVTKVNPEFAKIIDELDPGPEYWLAKVTYPYGSEVMKRSLLMLPNKDGKLVPVTDDSLDTEIREGLSYNLLSNPVSLVLKNSFEIFLPLEDRTIPLSGPIRAGSAFGAWRVLNPEKAEQPAFIWDMTSGVRSVFMLPKISETKKHLQLKRKYNLTTNAPKSLMGHWGVFKELCNSQEFTTPWDAEILYFSDNWTNHLEDSLWKPFYYYFQDSGWGNSELWRNQFIWNLTFSLILKEYETRPSAYIMDTTKYLLYAAMGAFSAFAPAQNNLAGPLEEIQKIYTEEYGLMNYPPIIMGPAIFDMENTSKQSVYYSLQFHNASEFKPSSRVRTSIVSDLHEIRSLMIRYESELLSNKFNIEKTSLDKIFRKVQYDYFHNTSHLHTGMRSTAEMPIEDKSLMTTIDGKVHKSFPESCAFVKGCIRLSHKS